MTTPSPTPHDHDLAVALERETATVPGHGRVSLRCRDCGWSMIYDGYIPPCAPPRVLGVGYMDQTAQERQP